MLKLRQAVIVEGKYDKIKLQSVIDAVIITTDGFRIYKSKDKMRLIQAFAKKDGIIILTDSDHAGFQIRNHIKGCIADGKIYNVYIPDIFGKERRKEKPSAENKLGVEGIDAAILKELLKKAFIKSGIMTENSPGTPVFTRELLFSDRLIGAENSAVLRKRLTKHLGLPENLSSTALIDVLNAVFTIDEYKTALKTANNYKG